MSDAVSSLSEKTKEFIKATLFQTGLKETIVLNEPEVVFVEKQQSPFLWFIKIRVEQFPIALHFALKLMYWRGFFLGCLIGFVASAFILKL